MKHKPFIGLITFFIFPLLSLSCASAPSTGAPTKGFQAELTCEQGEWMGSTFKVRGDRNSRCVAVIKRKTKTIQQDLPNRRCAILLSKLTAEKEELYRQRQRELVKGKLWAGVGPHEPLCLLKTDQGLEVFARVPVIRTCRPDGSDCRLSDESAGARIGMLILDSIDSQNGNP